MIYRVAICEDEKIFSEMHKKICCDILANLNIDFQISVFDNSIDFLTNYSETKSKYDLFLLDIYMDSTNGIEIAKAVREKDEEATIIFITSSMDYVLQGYDVKALHYLIKPVDSVRLEQLILTDYKNKIQNKHFEFKSGSRIIRIPTNDIIALETVGRRVEITLPNEVHYFSGKLTELLNELPKEQFIRCHQAFAVNINNIRELTRQEAITITGKAIPISRTFIKEVQQAFLKHLRKI